MSVNVTTSAGGSIISGANPLQDPLQQFLLQNGCISIILSTPSNFNNTSNLPRVIAEVVAGIILGKSALSKIDWFQDTVFPTASLPILNVIAQFGLILFLFLVGMEIDPSKMLKNGRQSAFISLAGIGLPFCLGVGVSKILYDNLMPPNSKPFTSFLVFTGVAMSITAFPVLARILTERKLLRVEVGRITLSAAALDDALAWILLILAVALVNQSSNYIIALYVFLVIIGYALFLYFAVQPLFVKLVSLQNENDNISQTSVFMVFCLVCISAWFTEAIGVSSIFGGFLAGIIIPHEHGFAIKLTEKIEDIVTILLLPLYFAYSGLNTRIDELNDGQSWGYVFLVIATACIGKVVGCGGAARLSGIPWRESITIGFLMNTKGLVEIIVLNIGRDAGVITDKIFTILLVMALATTFITVPIVSIIYPMNLYLKPKNEANRLPSIDKNKDNVTEIENESNHDSDIKDNMSKLSCLTGHEKSLNLLVCISNLTNLPSLVSLTQIIQSAPIDMDLFALRLISLSERNSTLLIAAETGDTIKTDAALSLFRTFTQLNRIGYKPLLSVSHHEDFVDNILASADEVNANLVIVPWTSHTSSKTKRTSGINSYYDNHQRAQLIESLFSKSRNPVVIFIDRGFTIQTQSYDHDVSIRSKKDMILSTLDQKPQQISVLLLAGINENEPIGFSHYFTHFPGIIVKIVNIFNEKKGSPGHPSPLKINLKSGLNDPIDTIRCQKRVQYEEISSSEPIQTCINWLKGRKVGDLVIVGKGLYDLGGVGQVIEECCEASVCVVKQGPIKK